MQEQQEVMLAVWREVCRHIEIGQSVRTITPMLLDNVPLEQLVVRRLDRRRSCVETVALGLPERQNTRLEAMTPCSVSQRRRLATWAKRREVLYHARGSEPRPEMTAAFPFFGDRDLLLGPLCGADDSLGVLVLVAAADRGFAACHRAVAAALLDALSAALANDERLREMTALREAAEAENRSLLQRLGRKRLDDAIVGVQSGLRDVMERVELVARSDAPVLIFGETGTGKELVARAIHARSSRAEGPVLRVNCGAIPPELIDSELFGHERGAFTGAVDSRKGWFERADGGTLFLDEIGELPAAAQVRLLGIVQDGWFERVGGEEPVHVDVRIVAATHRDLADMVARALFRADLWYRIAVFPLVLPPLRERQEDIAELAAHFARRAATRFSLPEILPTAEDVQLLASYSWPGNVRELAAVIDRAAILGNGRQLEVRKALGVNGGSAAKGQLSPIERSDQVGNRGPVDSGGRVAEITPLDQAMREHIEAAMAVTAGRVEGRDGAAALLGINPNTLRGRMRKLKIDWRRFRA